MSTKKKNHLTKNTEKETLTSSRKAVCLGPTAISLTDAPFKPGIEVALWKQKYQPQ